MERSDLIIRRSVFDVQCSMLKNSFADLLSRRIGPNRFGSLGLSAPIHKYGGIRLPIHPG
jgi:hypothetical protein